MLKFSRNFLFSNSTTKHLFSLIHIKPFSTKDIFSLFLTTFEPASSILIKGLTAFHTNTCAPWWFVIGFSTITLRAAITLPLAIYQQKQITKIEFAVEKLREFEEPLKFKITTKCRQQGLSSKDANSSYRKEFKILKHEMFWAHNLNPYFYRFQLTVLPLFQLPLFIAMSLSIRNLCAALPSWYRHTESISGMNTEGMLWFTNMTVPDSYYILPALFVTCNLANISIYALQGKTKSLLQNIVSNAFRILTLFMGVVASQLPSAMTLYWFTSSFYGLLQNIILKLPKFRRFARIPQTPSESQQPLKDIAAAYQLKLQKFFEIIRISDISNKFKKNL